MGSVEVLTVFIAAVISIASRARGDCPRNYTRFSVEHSACIRRNPSCDVSGFGVTESDKRLIVFTHNMYRSKIAKGEVNSGAGALPPAANMMQMEWDDELADIAQKWAFQCRYRHDCKECRAVKSFNVGQIVIWGTVEGCTDKECKDPNWKPSIKTLFDNVSDFDKSKIKNFEGNKEYRIFTQVAWANTWKVGCGVVSYTEKNRPTKIKVCNYGPAGNQVQEDVYQIGKPCSACPSRTHCGSDKKDGTEFFGLCKSDDITKGPIYEDKKAKLLDCNWKDQHTSCDVKIEPVDGWKLQPAYGEWYKTIILHPGETSTIRVTKLVKPNAAKFCVKIVSRRGPLVASEKDLSQITVLLNDRTVTVDNGKFTDFTVFTVDASWGDATKVSLVFSVPKGATDHIFDIKSITAFDGPCNSEKTNS